MKTDITGGVIWKQLLSLFFPILLGTFFQQLYNTADAIIVGRFLGKEALAAVGGGTGTLINLLVGFFVGVSSGAAVIISQFYGAGKHRETRSAVHTAFAVAVCSGIIITVIGYVFSPATLAFMNTPPRDFPPRTRVYPHLFYRFNSFNGVQYGGGHFPCYRRFAAPDVLFNRFDGGKHCVRLAVYRCFRLGHCRSGMGYRTVAVCKHVNGNIFAE